MILVTGGTGVMGSALVKRLGAAGETVRVLAVPDDPFVSRLDGIRADIRFGTLENPDSLEGICDGVSMVYHLAAVIIAFDDSIYRTVNVDGTDAVVKEAIRSGVRHFVYVSSASVVYPATTAYSRSKRDAEKVVQESGIPFTIVRPTLVYDRGRGGLEYDQFLEYLAKFPVVPFIGRGRAVKRPVYVEDIIDGLVRLSGCDKALGKILNFSGSETITIREYARLSLELLGQGRKPIVSVPVWLCRILSVVMGAVMKYPPLRWPVIAGITQDADLDPRESCVLIGYKPVGVRGMLPKCFPRTTG